ncbi:DUF5994 family protein [Prauserella endophytica]|uniref:DUF5994 family protein n=1 Tax=Prauserella endophytica TaxID=1592324 RepID=UPI00197EFB85|nr:DUF5994 family protein [Prauserella endophytica]
MALKPRAAAMGMVDGAWWPRSWEPVAEFPAMIAGIEWRLGRAARIAFNADAWAEAPRRLVVDGQPVELEGFRSLDEHTVLVSGHGWHRMVLLVIPPETSERAAAAALERAADPGNTEQATQILFRSGADSGFAEVTVPVARTGAGAARPR